MAFPRKATGCVVLLAACWLVAAPMLAELLIVEKRLERADAIVILAGSATYRERCLKAAEIFRNGVSYQVFLTDDQAQAGWSTIEQRTLPFVELARRELILHGVPSDSIKIFPDPVESTADEARLVTHEVMKNRWRSVLLVTSAYHSSRTLRVFERTFAAKHAEADVGIVFAPLGQQTPAANWWWLSSAGWRDVAWEYAKTGYYYLAY